MTNRTYQALLAKLNIHPVLVDIGASGGTPSIWKSLASQAIYIGFDPDHRDLQEITDGQFYKGFIVNKAVSSDSETPETTFYLTRSPHCSSTLQPDTMALSNYLFADLFTVVGQASVPTTTLNAVVAQLEISNIDWMKLDSQGTDLRLIRSLHPQTFSHLLAVDIEPGLMDAYQGEDLFVDAHKYLVENGFWLSNLSVKGSVRIKQTTLQEIIPHFRKVTWSTLQQGVRKSPGWCEARYLRTPESLQTMQESKRSHVLLWIFALIDQQPGFALDLAVSYKQTFGDDEIAQIMLHEPVAFIKKTLPLHLIKKSLNIFMSKVNNFLPRNSA
jgi:FkbM family methyltransferase